VDRVFYICPILQISGKVAVGVVRTLEIFRVTCILGASRGRLCDSSAVLCIYPTAGAILLVAVYVAWI